MTAFSDMNQSSLFSSSHNDYERFRNFNRIDEDQFEVPNLLLTKSLYSFKKPTQAFDYDETGFLVDIDVKKRIAGKSPSPEETNTPLDANNNDDEENKENEDDFIERMQTIAIRKSENGATHNKYRRKSMFPTLLGNDERISKNSWNYDEINDLRLKFISLLSDSGVSTCSSSMIKSDSSDTYETKRHSLDPIQMQDLAKTQVQPQLTDQLAPITHDDCLKIKSFYQSYGTQLYVSQTYGTLYTLTHNDLSKQYDMNKILDCLLLADMEPINKENMVIGQHVGIPLWLFNSGMNPRRPCRQLKLTLAEHGTGFILWQDRIDARSELKIFLKRPNSQYYTIDELSDRKKDQISIDKLFVISFKASDRKTTIFLKFNVKAEFLSFFDYFKKTHHRICDELKQRTKSLPVRSIEQQKLFNTGLSSMATGGFLDRDMDQFKFRRISKRDISKPFSLRHFISIKSTDKHKYYTLSKLLN